MKEWSWFGGLLGALGGYWLTKVDESHRGPNTLLGPTGDVVVGTMGGAVLGAWLLASPAAPQVPPSPPPTETA